MTYQEILEFISEHQEEYLAWLAAQQEENMFIDWDDNGEFDIFDLGITLAILEDEEDDTEQGGNENEE